MKRAGIYRKTVALVMAIMVTTGSFGFSVEKHECSHCGTSWSLSLFNDITDNSDSCTIPDEPVSCCSGEADTPSHHGATDSCSLEANSCCKYETVDIKIEQPVIKEIKKVSPVIEVPEAPVPLVLFSEGDPRNPEIHSSFQKMCGRSILSMCCQYRT